jgi:hypothetical protein
LGVSFIHKAVQCWGEDMTLRKSCMYFFRRWYFAFERNYEFSLSDKRS